MSKKLKIMHICIKQHSGCRKDYFHQIVGACMRIHGNKFSLLWKSVGEAEFDRQNRCLLHCWSMGSGMADAERLRGLIILKCCTCIQEEDYTRKY